MVVGVAHLTNQSEVKGRHAGGMVRRGGEEKRVVEKWESRRLCGIPKGAWEAEETRVWFSPLSMLPPFPRRFSLAAPISFSPWLLNRPTTWGPKRIETVSSRCS